MTPLPPLSPEMADLLESLCLEELSPADAARLEDLVCSDVQCCRQYILFMEMHALVERFGGEGQGAGDQRRGMVGSPAIDGEEGFGIRDSGFGGRDSEPLSAGAAVELPSGPEPRTPSPEPPFPVLSTTNYPLPTSHFSVDSWAFSYMVATVIMGVMLLGFWAYKITHYQHIAEAPSQSVPSDVRQEMVFVGRITGMVDVKWSDDPHYLPPPGFAHVPLDRKYKLDSGLLEITYDSGAKVILEGPCTYEVESTAGGYLALGKLTARVEKRGGKGSRSKVQGSRSKAEPSSFILHPSPLFSVRTPTAIVTDLGTEFGIEVAEDGRCEVHLIKGRVLARRVGVAAGKLGEEVQLSRGQAVRFDPDQAKPTFISVAPAGFRSMRACLVRKRKLTWPIVDKTLVAWVSLANLSQQGGGVISIEQPVTHEFDGIAFAELAPRRWWAASNNYARSQGDQPQNIEETVGPEQLVQIAIVYKWNRITIFRDGQVFANYNTYNKQTFGEDSFLLMGKRCVDRTWIDPPAPSPPLVGSIEEARLYDVGLSQVMIAAMKPNKPSPIAPVGLWTFEDGTARDETGNFPPGELRGNANIVNGKLILDGRESYLYVPPATANKRSESNGKNGEGKDSLSPQDATDRADARIKGNTERKGVSL